MRKPGRRVTIHHNPAYAARLIEVSQTEGEDRAKAYLRLAMRGKTHRVVGKDGKMSLVIVNGSRDNPFRIPASACKTAKSATNRRTE